MSREMDLGALKIRLKLDQVDESIKALKDVQTEFDNTGTAAKDFTDDVKDVDAGLGAAGSAAGSFSSDIAGVDTQLGTTGGAVGGFENDIKSLDTQFDKTGVEAGRFTEEVNQLDNQMGKAGSSAQDFANKIKTLDQRMESVSKSLAKGAQGLLAVADIIESSSKFVEIYGEQLGMTEEEITKLTGTLENLQKPLIMGAQALMGFSDALEVAKWAHESLKISMLTNPITLILLAIAAAVAILFFAWKNNWGGMHDMFDRVWARLHPAFETMSRILKKLGFETGEFGEVFDAVFTIIGFLLETILVPLIDAFIMLVGWIEQAIDAWNEFWGTQQARPIAATSPQTGATVSPTYTTTYNTTQTNVYGGVNAYGGAGTTEEGWNAMSAYQASRTGVR